jgi:polyisoprenoid-binding protein YceI
MQTATQKGLALVKYSIDKTASRFTVQAFATGLLSAFGHNPTIAIRDYEGEIQFVPGTYEKALVRLTLQTAAMEVLDEIKSDDRKKLEYEMNENVLDVKHFPSAVYQSKEVSVQKLSDDLLQAQVTGDLLFHGVTQTQSVDARVTNLNTLLRISGGFSLRQSDFGIRPLSFAAGTLRLKDEVKFNFELVARKQD